MDTSEQLLFFSFNKNPGDHVFCEPETTLDEEVNKCVSRKTIFHLPENIGIKIDLTLKRWFSVSYNYHSKT